MSGLDLETAVRAPAPITTVLLNNGGMATYPPAISPPRANVSASATWSATTPRSQKGWAQSVSPSQRPPEMVPA